jgi:hypothetical protein
VVSYHDPASSSPLSSSSPETISEGGFLDQETLKALLAVALFNASRSRAFLT